MLNNANDENSALIIGDCVSILNTTATTLIKDDNLGFNINTDSDHVSLINDLDTFNTDLMFEMIGE